MSKLYIYLIAAGLLALVFTGMTAVIYKYRGDAIEAEALAASRKVQLDIALQVNADNEKALSALEAKAERNDALAAELQDELNASNASTLALAQRIAALRSGNSDVQSFFDQLIPDAVLGLYNDAGPENPSPD